MGTGVDNPDSQEKKTRDAGFPAFFTLSFRSRGADEA